MFKNSQKIHISKRLIIPLVFIVLLFAGFGVSIDDTYAIDVNQSTDAISSELNIEDKFVNSQESMDSMNDNNESLLGATQDSQILGADPSSEKGGTFADIKSKVTAASPGATIKLSGTYTAKSASDTIVLDKKLHFTSDSGTTLNAKNLCQIFNIKSGAAGSSFNNIKFENGNSKTVAGALYVRTNNIKVTNCVFKNNFATDAAAIYTDANSTKTRNLRVENCEFYNNRALNSAGALAAFGNNSIIKNCIFDGNIVRNDDDPTIFGGAIQVSLGKEISYATVDRCVFQNNQVISKSTDAHGGAGCVRDGTTYKNCIFINNSAPQGGALKYHGGGTIKNCTFINNTAYYNGGALNTGLLNNLVVQNCSFEDNKAQYGGAAYLNGRNVEIYNCNFDNNYASVNGGAINVATRILNLHDVNFEDNVANVDGGALYIEGLNTTIKDSSFISNSAIPDANKLDDGLGGAIYVNSTYAIIDNNEFYYNTARNGSAVYYDKYGENLKLSHNTMYQNQAWVYLLPVYAQDIYYGNPEKISSVIHGGNNIARYGDLAVSNAVYNAAKNEYLEIDGETPQNGATTNGHLYQDDREYNMDILLTVNHEDGTVVYNNTLNSNVFGQVEDTLNNLKAGKYYVTARHIEDTYYKGITNTTTFTVTPKIDDKVRKSISSDEDINYQDVVIWTLNITNNGPSNATNVKVCDVLPEGLIWINDDTNGKYNPETGILTIDFLAVGDVFIVNIWTTVNKTGIIENNVNITADEYDYNMTNNHDNESINVNPSCDLAVVKSANQSTFDYGKKVKWTITVTNNGPDIAHNVVVSDILPKSLIFLSSTGNYNNATGEWNIGTLAKGAKVSMDIICKINATGLIENTVSVSGEEHDVNPSNNYDNEIINVNPSADLSMLKVVNVTAANLGDIVKWTLTVTNNGPDAATGVNVSDVLPSAFAYVDSSRPYKNGVISIGNVAVGESVSVDILTRVKATGTFVNVASVEGSEYDWDLSNNKDDESLKVNPAADLVVDKRVNDTNPDYKGTVKWTITVINNGPDIAHNVTVSDILPKSLIFISSNGNYNNATGKWDVGTLTKNQRVSLEIVTRVNGTGLIENTVNVTGAEFDINKTNNVDKEVIDVDPSADLSMLKVVNATAVNLGDIVKWTLTVTNNGPDAATGVNVSDILPSAFAYVDSSRPYKNGVISIGNVAVGESVSVDILTRVIATGTFVNVASVEGREYDWDLSNNKDDGSLKVNPAADLVVDKKVNDTNPDYKGTVKWTITVTNNGPDIAHDVVVYDVLPKSLIFISSNGNYNNATGKWDVGTLTKNQRVTLEIITKVNATGMIENTVNVTGREFDINKTNNVDKEVIDVNSSADLVMLKVVNATAVNLGDIVKWTLTVTNNGPDAATGVNVSDILPSAFAYMDSSKPYVNGVISMGNVAVGESVSVDILTRVIATGTFVNVASVEGREYDWDLSNNKDDESLKVNPAADLVVDKKVNDTNPDYKGTVKWTITVTNNGPDIAHNVTVSDILPKSLIFISSNGNYNNKTGEWNIGTLTKNQSVTLEIVTRVNATGLIENSVNVTGREFDINKTNNVDKEVIDVDPSADLVMLKVVNATAVNLGDIVKWTLTVTNNGPDMATGVNVSDVLPSAFAYVDSSRPYKNGVINIGNVAVGGSVSVNIITRVIATGTFVNVASVEGSEYDWDLSNNKDDESLKVNPAADLIVIKQVNQSAPNYNSTITWTITVINNGPDIAHDVTVVDVLPKSLIFITSNGNYNNKTGEWNIGTLTKNQRVTLEIITKVNGTGLIENNVSVSGREFDINKTNNFDNQTINVSKASDLSVVKIVNSSTEDYLNLIKWTVIVHNNGPDNATGVIVDEILPDGLVLINYNASKGFYDNGMWSICCMEVGSTQTLELICRINRTGTITNVVEVSGNEYDPDPSNNVYNESVFVPLSSDLAIVKNVNNSNPDYGDVIEWSITVINNGPDDTTDVLVVDNLPKGLRFISYESTAGSFYESYWDIESLKAGENQTLIIRCVVESLDDIENIAEVIPSQYDWNESNNIDSEKITVNPVADLEITKLVNVSTANYLDLVKWTLIVKNNGPNDATGVFVIDDIPEGLEIIKVIGKGDYEYGIWDIGDLANGESVTLEVICKIKATGDFTNVANVYADETDPDSDNNEDENYLHVPPASDLSITKTVKKARYTVGSVVKYSIKLSNAGPDRAENIKVREVMDDGLDLLSFHASAGDFDEVNDVWSLDSLGAGHSALLKINAIAKKAGALANNVFATSDNYDPNLKNNNDTVTVNVFKNNTKIVKEPKKHSYDAYKAFSDSVLSKNKSGNPIMVIVLLFVFTMGAFYGNNILKKR